MRTTSHIATALVFACALSPFLAFAAVSSDVHFLPDGTFSAKNITVYQKAGNNLFTRATWGQAFIRIVVIPNASTTVIKAHGEQAGVKDIHEQDVLDVEGALATGADSIVINATVIHDSNLQQESKTLSGTVVSVDTAARAFQLSNKTFGKTTIAVGDTPVTKGARTIGPADLVPGDKILSVSGAYDYSSNILQATSLSVYQDASVFKARNFEGALKSISGTALPASAVVTVGSTDYTVYFPENSAVLNKAKGKASLSRFVVGDTVRFYGAVRQTNLTEIDAEVLRDLNF